MTPVTLTVVVWTDPKQTERLKSFIKMIVSDEFNSCKVEIEEVADAER